MPAGRKPSLDNKQKADILKVIRNGGGRKLAADYVGSSVPTIKREEARNEQFRHQIKKAKAASELFHLARIRRGVDNWTSSAWFLERTNPRYMKREHRQKEVALDFSATNPALA